MDEEGDANIYEDLPDFRYDKTLDQLNGVIAKLETENQFLQSKLAEITEEKNFLEANCKVLNTNISSLLKTAKMEIKRKERNIVDLREQLNKVRPEKKQFGTKRRRETIATPSPRKKPKLSPRKVPESRKFSPRKVREERPTSRRNDRESNSKPKIRETANGDERPSSGKRASPSDNPKRDERSTPVVTERHNHMVTDKENAPMRETLVSKEPQVIGNSAAPSKNSVGPSPAIATPLPPAIQCSTVFSLRMFNRIYGRECGKEIPTLAAHPLGLTDSIKPSGDGEPQTLPSGSSNQRPLSSNCSRVTPKDIRIYLGVENSLSSDSSLSNSSINLEVKPVASSYIKPRNGNSSTVNVYATSPQNVNVPISLKVTEADIDAENQKHAERPLKKFVAPTHLPSAGEPHSVPSMPLNEEPGHQKHVILPLEKSEVPTNQPPAVGTHSVPSVPPEEKPVKNHVQKLEVPIFQPPVSASHSVPSILPPEKPNQKRANLPFKKSDVQISQPSQFEPHLNHTIPSEGVENIPSDVNLEQSSAKVTPAKMGLLAVGKTRQQMVAAIRPIQKLAARESPAIVGKSDLNRLMEHKPKAYNGSSPKSDMMEINSVVRGAEKSGRSLKIPGLSGPGKGRTARQVFAPISNQWNCPHPGTGNQNDTNEKCYNDMPIVKTVSVTSELTVRVEDSKLDELKKQSSAEALFGSPVKWADDSLDSPITDGPANSRRLYSIFGSPLKSFDSNSSEHPFSVPPAAYEDSCWTNQVPEKNPTNPPNGDNSIQKQSQRSQEPAAGTETKVKEKILEHSDTEKFIPPPPLSVIKKHVSIFSPVKDSKLSVTSNIPDEPSRSNTGICFPFPRPKYEDSVLGQFDDTAQFVSALAKVDTQISPLSTPIKSGEGSDPIQSVIVEKNPTSFQQVFKKNGPDRTPQIHELPNLGEDTDATEFSGTPDHAVLPKSLPNKEDGAETPTECELPSLSSKEDREISSKNKTIHCAESLRPQKIEPPRITITPPKTECSVRLIHRPNFASSTILSVKSWFPDAPVKIVTPRKTPRLVSSLSRSASPKGLDVNAGARIAINDAFIIEQEERVRRWELDLYENIRSGGGSPMKSANDSPVRNRIESPGKISPSKRTPKKQISPCKSSKRAEVRGDMVKSGFHCTAGDVTDSISALNKDKTLNEIVPCSANQSSTAVHSIDVISSQISTKPTQYVSNSTQKVLTMIDAVTNHTKPVFASSSAEANKSEGVVSATSVDITSMGAKSQSEDNGTVVNETGVVVGFGPERLSGSTLKQENVPSGVVISVHTPCSGPVAKGVTLENATNEQALLTDPPAPIVSCQISPPCPSLLFNDKSSPHPQDDHPVDDALSLKDNIVSSSKLGSAELGSSSKVEASKLLPVQDKPSTKVKANANKKLRTAIHSRNDSTISSPIPPPKSSSPECHTPDNPTANKSHIGKKMSFSKYEIISRVKPSTPLNKSVAALLSSSVSSKSPASSRSRIPKTPSVQTTKCSAFKRSSALKSDNTKGTGNNLMNSIRSTFFQTTPTSSAKASSSRAKTPTPLPNIQPRLIRRKSEPNLSAISTNTVVSVKSTSDNPGSAPAWKRNPTTAFNAGSRGPVVCVGKDGVTPSKTALGTVACYNLAQRKGSAESVVQDSVILLERAAKMVSGSIPGQWKLLEVDHQTKPISLLKRFKESRGGLLYKVDAMSNEKLNARTDESKAENDKRCSAAQSLNLHDPMNTMSQEKPETQGMPKLNYVKVLNRDGIKFPPKSPVFPRSTRKTILLDSPLRMNTPTKVKKRLQELSELPKPEEKSCKPKEKHDEPKSGKKARTTSVGKVALESASPKKSNNEAGSREVALENSSPKEFRDHKSQDRSQDPKPVDRSKDHESGDRSQNHETPDRSQNHETPDRSRDHKSRDGSRDHKSRDGSRDHKSRDGSRDHKSRDGSRDHKSRDGSRDHKSRDGSRDHKSRDGSRDHKSRDGSRDHKSRDGSRDHKSPAKSQDRSQNHKSKDKSRNHKPRDHKSRARSRDRKSRERSRDRTLRRKSRNQGSRNRSHSISPRRSRRKNCDMSPKPRKKARSTRNDSPVRSPARKSSKSSDRKSKIATKASAGQKTKGDNQESKSVSSESNDKQSKNSAAESVAKRYKASTSDSGLGTSKTSSSDENPRKVCPESVDDEPVVQITSSAPRQKADLQITASQNNPQSSQTTSYAKAGISSSTPARSDPVLVIRRNRTPKFSSASEFRQTEIVITAEKRPALFSRSS